MNMSVGVLDHYNVSTRKLKETVQFYEEILGFVNGPRPQFNFPRAWLYSAGHAVLHLNDISQTDRQQRPDSGVIDHVAFTSRGFEAMKQHLTGKGLRCRIYCTASRSLAKLFAEFNAQLLHKP
jgi:catechol 2,3-dioxygenase-like lactoylglutathione lyase family enzyme